MNKQYWLMKSEPDDVSIDDALAAPGGVVPWHSHDERPALIYVAIGEVTEYASNCAVPIVHHPGEVAVERKGVSHWWRNTGAGTVVLISADLLMKQGDDAMM